MRRFLRLLFVFAAVFVTGFVVSNSLAEPDEKALEGCNKKAKEPKIDFYKIESCVIVKHKLGGVKRMKLYACSELEHKEGVLMYAIRDNLGVTDSEIYFENSADLKRTCRVEFEKFEDTRWYDVDLSKSKTVELGEKYTSWKDSELGGWTVSTIEIDTGDLFKKEDVDELRFIAYSLLVGSSFYTTMVNAGGTKWIGVVGEYLSGGDEGCKSVKIELNAIMKVEGKDGDNQKELGEVEAKVIHRRWRD